MRENELLERAFAMPLTNPAYPPDGRVSPILTIPHAALHVSFSNP
jgi:hypothetical protein